MDATDVGALREDDRVCLEELGQYLVAAETWRRFGIWLLHRHFVPAPGEIFVERTFRALRETAITPVQRSAFPERGLGTTAIRFDNSVSRDVGVIGLEFAEPVDFGDATPLRNDDEAALAGIAEQLGDCGMIDRFGVRLIRNPLRLSEHELLYETCDGAQWTLNCTVGERDALLADETVVETAWRWKVVWGKTLPSVMGECIARDTTSWHRHFEPDDFGND
ncbi:MAG TPA: hypothetical protein VMU34_17505 [Mycobacterium sp.]|nr:hypothetical protein [Mycobacterium sp.]